MNDYLKGKSFEEFGIIADDLIKKAERTSDKDWEDIIDEFDLGIHRDVLRKGFCSPFGGYPMYRYMLEKFERENSENSMLEKIKAERKELLKEKVRFQDQKREYMSLLRMDARFEHLKDSMIEAINNSSPVVLEVKPVNKYGDNHACLMLSDWHCGLEVENNWNKFNKEILKQRVEKLQNKVIDIIKTHKIGTLHMELMGDLINGLIHVTTRISNEEDVIQQVMTVSDILANFIVNVSNEVEELNVYSTTGNHGRVVSNIKENLNGENFEKLITWYLEPKIYKLTDGKIKNVKFIENEYDDNIAVIKFLNETIFSVHGHEDKLKNGVDELCKMMKMFCTEIHQGHLHSFYENEDHDMCVIVNGTLSGVDDFAKHIRKTCKPMQVCTVYNEEGRECTYKIKL